MKTKITLNSAPGARRRAPGARRTANRILKAEKVKGELVINLIDDKLMRKLNRRFRKKDKTTDVLSFEIGEMGILGEIYISYPTAVKQAREYGCSIQDELERLTAHGLLHILGYTHKEMREYGI